MLLHEHFQPLLSRQFFLLRTGVRSHYWRNASVANHCWVESRKLFFLGFLFKFRSFVVIHIDLIFHLFEFLLLFLLIVLQGIFEAGSTEFGAKIFRELAWFVPHRARYLIDLMVKTLVGYDHGTQTREMFRVFGNLLQGFGWFFRFGFLFLFLQLLDLAFVRLLHE
jgi:hypothetical protein